MAVTVSYALNALGGNRAHKIDVVMSAAGDIATVALPSPRNYTSPISIQAIWGTGTTALSVACTLSQSFQTSGAQEWNPGSSNTLNERASNQTANTTVTNIPSPNYGPELSRTQLTAGVPFVNDAGWNNGTGQSIATSGATGGLILLDTANTPWSPLPGNITAIASNTLIQINGPFRALQFITTLGGAHISIWTP